MKNKKYITPKTQVKKIDTEMLMEASVTISTAQTNNGGWAKKGSSIWEEN